MQCYQLFNATSGDRGVPKNGQTVFVCNNPEAPDLIRSGIKPKTNFTGCYDDDWRFSKPTEDLLRKSCVLLNTRVEPFPDMMGHFRAVPSKDRMPEIIVSQPLVRCLETYNPDCFQFVPSGPFLDRETGEVIEDHGFYHVSFLDERSTYDTDLTKIIESKTHDGRRTFTSVAGLSYIDTSKVGDGIIWRETLGGGLICSQRFKDIFDQNGFTGIDFMRLRMV